MQAGSRNKQGVESGDEQAGTYLRMQIVPVPIAMVLDLYSHGEKPGEHSDGERQEIHHGSDQPGAEDVLHRFTGRTAGYHKISRPSGSCNNANR